MRNNMEQIERDREMLRNKTTEDFNFSYIPFIKTQKTCGKSLKLTKLSAFNILVYLEECFEKSDKHVLKKLESIKQELLGRPDLFLSVLMYLENKKVHDDVFYWIPGCKISNIFCFIVDLIPNFIHMYKEYCIERIVCGKKFYDALNFIKGRFPEEYEHFNLINMDLSMFKHCISTSIWGLGDQFIDQRHLEVLNELKIPARLDFKGDLEAHIATKASFAEIVVDGKEFTVPLDALIGLKLKDEKYAPYWKKHGIFFT
ncbi:hypothetical protein GINT2_001552 [Glugoides intestinalis]